MTVESNEFIGEGSAETAESKLERYQDLKRRGFTEHLFDRKIDEHEKAFNKLINETNAKGLEKETIFDNEYAHVFVKEEKPSKPEN